MKMFIENESIYGFNDTVEKLSESIVSNGWKVTHVHDLHETLKKNNFDVLPVKVLEVCRPDYSVKLLRNDSERIYSSLMPCRLSVYETSDGKTKISRMNSGVLAAQIGGIVEEVMSVAFSDMENILKQYIKN
ncbi:MAG: hypothetical protein ACD_77C00179G0014 [uncultured bacterium]|nr:MAG: hypothetical protein ACD_77C00179G0014 [uncultured bacterium]